MEAGLKVTRALSVPCDTDRMERFVAFGQPISRANCPLEMSKKLSVITASYLGCEGIGFPLELDLGTKWRDFGGMNSHFCMSSIHPFRIAGIARYTM